VNVASVVRFAVSVLVCMFIVGAAAALFGIIMAGSIAAWVAFAGAFAFPLLYLRSPWEKSAVGRDAMLLGVCFAAILGYNVVRLAIIGPGVPPDFEVPRLIIYGVLAVVLPRRALLLWQLQRKPDVFIEAEVDANAAMPPIPGSANR
jgi:hypothetical protein